MIVTSDNILDITEKLSVLGFYGLDTETYGLDFKDKLFSIIISSKEDDYYFNFNPRYPNYLGDRGQLKGIFNKNSTWFIHNAKFDMQKLALDGLFIEGKVCDTMVMERLLYNNHMNYSLDACAKRYCFEKDKAVEEYIIKNKLYDMVEVPGRKAKKKNKHYDLVPFELITKYGQKDARICLEMGLIQYEKLGLNRD